MTSMKEEKVLNRAVRDVLRLLVTGSRFPVVVSYPLAEMPDDVYLTLQGYAVSHARLPWQTGIGILEAADKMVKEALDNGNFRRHGYYFRPTAD